MDDKKIRPQDRWDQKSGLIAKTYKINKEVAQEYQRACEKAGVAMGPQLTKLMMKFIEDVNKDVTKCH